MVSWPIYVWIASVPVNRAFYSVFTELFSCFSLFFFVHCVGTAKCVTERRKKRIMWRRQNTKKNGNNYELNTDVGTIVRSESLVEWFAMNFTAVWSLTRICRATIYLTLWFMFANIPNTVQLENHWNLRIPYGSISFAWNVRTRRVRARPLQLWCAYDLLNDFPPKKKEERMKEKYTFDIIINVEFRQLQ